MRKSQWFWTIAALVIGVCLCGKANASLIVNPNSNTLWVEEFNTLELNDDRTSGWGNSDPDQVSVEPVVGKARLREIAQQSWGSLERYIPSDCRPTSNYRYLQIRVAAIENIKNGLLLGNASTGGLGMGKMFVGVTTVDLSAQPFYGSQGNWALSLTMIGQQGTEPGGWLDVDWIKCVKLPVSGLTMELLEKDEPNRTAEVGETIILRYFAGEKSLEKPIDVRFFFASKMLPYSFDGEESVLLRDDGRNGDEKAGDRIYSKAISIKSDTISLESLKTSTDGLNALLASAVVGAESVHTYAPFYFDIKTERKLDILDSYGATPLTVQNRLRWMRETKGENLALGKRVRYSLTPDYGLTTDAKDTEQLTDGKLSTHGDDKIWFDSEAVGWYESARPTQGLNILLDLGSVQPVGKVVARFLSGGEQGSLLAPSEITVVASEDGKQFYKVASLIKLMPAERDRANQPGNYYIAEDGTAYVYPFAFPLKMNARYIGLAVKGATDSVFCDEIAVLKGSFPSSAASRFIADRRVTFVTEGIIFGPMKPKLAIATNINVPNFFRTLDCRPAEARSKEAMCVIELPAQVKFLASDASKGIKSEDFEADGLKWKRWSFTMPSNSTLWQMPFYLSIAGKLPKNPKAVFYARCEGFEPNRVTVPLIPIKIPKVPRLNGMHVSLAWMGEGNALDWPGFFDAWEQMGFNAVSTFPRYWYGTIKPDVAAWLAEARKRGFNVVYNESPFHEMGWIHRTETEMNSQLAGGPSQNPCPSYRGRFYQEEIKRVGDCYEMCAGDYVFYDIEYWYNGAREAGLCSRCLEWQAKSGKSMDECLVDMGAQMKSDMFNEIQARSKKLGRKMPIIGMYDLNASDPVYESVDDFRLEYPNLVQLSQPSLYCMNRIQYAHDTVRADFEALKGKKGVILPWLTAGTYGEADSAAIEALILECFMNGATGITYFCFTDFDTALDYQAHALALAAIAPYQKLLLNGTSYKVKVDAPGVLASGWWNGRDEMLLLLGNYDNSLPASVKVKLPFGKVMTVKNVLNGKMLPVGKMLNVKIPAKGFGFYYIQGAAVK